jgi:hypothetical protein
MQNGVVVQLNPIWLGGGGINVVSPPALAIHFYVAHVFSTAVTSTLAHCNSFGYADFLQPGRVACGFLT